MSPELRLGFPPKPLWVFDLELLQLFAQSLERTLAIEYASRDPISPLPIQARIIARILEQDQRAGDLCDGFESAADARVEAFVGMVIFVETFADCEAKGDDADGRGGAFCHYGVCCELGKTGKEAVEVEVPRELTG